MALISCAVGGGFGAVETVAMEVGNILPSEQLAYHVDETPNSINGDYSGYIEVRDLPHGVRYKIRGGKDSWLPAWSKAGDLFFTSYTTVSPVDDVDIYQIKARVSRPQDITNNEGFEGNLSISPDGEFLAFTSDRNNQSNYDLYIMSLQTYDVVQITEGLEVSQNISWSPNGKMIAFEGFIPTGSPHSLYIQSIDGGSPILVADDFDFGNSGIGISWSPDSRKLAATIARYTSDDDNHFGNIYVFDMYKLLSEGRDEGEKITTGYYDQAPIWNKDGSSIVYVTQNSLLMGIMDLKTVDVATRHVTAITQGQFTFIVNPSFIKDNSEIMFSGVFAGSHNSAIFKLNPVSGQIQQMSPDNKFANMPAYWQTK